MLYNLFRPVVRVRYTTRLKLPHWGERSDIHVHFHTTESLEGDDLVIRHPCHTLELGVEFDTL